MRSAHPDKLLTVDELARRLDVGHDLIRRMTREGRLPHLVVGRSVRFVWSEVCNALRTQETPA